MGGMIQDIAQQNCIVLHGVLTQVIPTTQYIDRQTGKPYYVRRIILSGIGDLMGNTICLYLPETMARCAYECFLNKHVVCYIHCNVIQHDATSFVNRLECWYIEKYMSNKIYPFNQEQLSLRRMERYRKRMAKKMEQPPVIGVQMDDDGYAILKK